MVKKPSIILYGAGGHGKVIADAVEKEGKFSIAGFLDSKATGTAFDLPILGGESAIPALKEKGITAAVVSIGAGDARKSVQEMLKIAGMTIVTVCHPSAQVARGASIGEGTVLMPGAVVGPDTVIGEGCIINTAATVDHDCVIGAFTHIAPGANIAGGVIIGALSHIGIGAALKQGVRIGNNVTVGAGSVVLEDLANGVTAYGVPAKAKV